MLNPGVSLIYETIIAILIPMIFIALIHWELLLAPLVFVAGYIVTLKDYTRRLNPVATAQREAFGAMNAGLEESVSGIETVKASAQEEFERGKFKKNAHAFRKYFVAQGRVEARYLPLLVFSVCVGCSFCTPCGYTVAARSASPT
jgi:ATP-binding cassette subfamily B protein